MDLVQGINFDAYEVIDDFHNVLCNVSDKVMTELAVNNDIFVDFNGDSEAMYIAYVEDIDFSNNRVTIYIY